MFLKRAAVTFTAGPLLLFLVTLGGWIYFWPITIVLTVAAYEYSKIVRRLGWRVPAYILLPMIWLQWFDAQFQLLEARAIPFIINLFVIMMYALWLYEYREGQNVLSSWFGLLGGVVIIGWLGSHFFWIRNLAQIGMQWTILSFVAIWVSDMGAYMVGRFVAGRGILGRHKMTPRLSPNKTVEGLLGGAVIATAVSLILAPFLDIPALYGLILGLVVSFVGPMGDLSISLVKREAGVKDSGNLFPGHGGAFDRMDSLLWATAVSYYLAILLY